MKLSDYNYNLPPERIAQFPPPIRGTSRLLVLDRSKGAITHRHYQDMIEYLNAGDLLILNNTKVIQARLLTYDDNNKPIEIFLLEKHGSVLDDTPNSSDEVRVIHRGKLTPNQILTIGEHKIIIKSINPDGTAVITTTIDPDTLADQSGSVPLPPYMKRDATPEDTDRYQTVFAQYRGSVAAPTASLNMTEELLQKLTAKGVIIKYLTLHVGLGTFLPIKTDDLSQHKMHQESFLIPADTVASIRHAKSSGHSIIAVGTTVTRALEYSGSEILDPSITRDITGEADIFIYPGYKFQIVDHLITNFHAPKSTVLMLTSAFAGWDILKPAYDSAIEHKYNFLSYGDSMFIF